MSRLPAPQFVLDANIFIDAYDDYYAPEFCPAFWDCIPLYFQAGSLISIDQVFAELLSPSELVQWARNAPSGFFAFSGDQPVVNAYTTIMDWVKNNPQFRPAAKTEFAAGADGWLIAYAKVNNAVVVTHEKFANDAKNRVPIPNVCRQFNVSYCNTFELLRQLGVRFVLDSTT